MNLGPLALEVFAKNPDSKTFKKEEEAVRKRNLRIIEEKVQEIIASIDPKITVEEETENDYYDNNCCEMDDDRNITLISYKIFRAFLQFAQLKRDEQIGAILSDSGIAILLFCSAIDIVFQSSSFQLLIWNWTVGEWLCRDLMVCGA